MIKLLLITDNLVGAMYAGVQIDLDYLDGKEIKIFYKMSKKEYSKNQLAVLTTIENKSQMEESDSIQKKMAQSGGRGTKMYCGKL